MQKSTATHHQGLYNAHVDGEVMSGDYCHHEVMTKKKKSKKESAKATLASVTKEMAQPRFAESARKQEDANRHVTAHRHRHIVAPI